MKIIRISILIISFLLASFFAFYGVIRGSHSDILLLLMIFFFSINAFYALYSKPTFVLSEIFSRAATGLALATLEMKHQAEEAKSREIEAIRSRTSLEESNLDKLSAARDFMKFAANNPYLRKHYDFGGASETSKKISESGLPKPSNRQHVQIEKLDRPQDTNQVNSSGLMDTADQRSI